MSRDFSLWAVFNPIARYLTSVRDKKTAQSLFQSESQSNNLQPKSRNGVNAALRFTQIEPYAGEFERRRPASQRGVWGSERCALVVIGGSLQGFPEGLAHQDNPQIWVLPPPVKLAAHKYIPLTASLWTSLIPN